MIPFASRMDKVNASTVRELLKIMNDPEIISFGGGSPAKESFPLEEIKSITAGLLAGNGIGLLQYGVTEGYGPLRQAYLEHIAGPKGIQADIDNVLIISGSNQGLDFATQVLLNPGDNILVESPTFLTAFMVFNKQQLNCIPVLTDEQGILIEDFEEKIKKYQPKMLYCIPTFQNPTGNTLQLERRKSIAELAAKYDVIVLEDDPYCDLRYSGASLPPIKSFDHSGHVIMLNSFSKIMAPGLRAGVMLADKEIIKKAVIAKQCNDTHACNLTQAICAEFLSQGLLPGHLRKIIPMYREKMELMAEGIERYFPAGSSFNRPEGGLFTWVKLPDSLDANQLLQRSLAEIKVAFVPGNSFFVNPEDGVHYVRLNFSSSTSEQIKDGIRRLGGLFCSALS